MRILIAETDEWLLQSIQLELTKHNFVVDIAIDGEIVWGLLQSFTYELVILPTILPKIDGITLCRRLRQIGNPLLIMLLVSPDNIQERIEGLESGADDCLIKPFNNQELFAHIQALRRRGVSKASPIMKWGKLEMNTMSHQVKYNGEILQIGRKEYLVLELFLSYPQQSFTRSEIADRLWALDDELPSDATIKTHICSLRRKLEKVGAVNFIETRYGYGYRLNPLFSITNIPPEFVGQYSEMIMDNATANIWYELMAANARLQDEIYERKEKERLLARSERLLRHAQKVGQIGVWEFHIDTKEVYWTEELYLIHGLNPDKRAPNPEEIINCIYPEDRRLHKNAVINPAIQHKHFETNLRILRTDQTLRYVNVRGGLFFDDHGNLMGLVGTTFDISNWKKT
jgi:DNA-binding response OmpR family regulator